LAAVLPEGKQQQGKGGHKQAFPAAEYMGIIYGPVLVARPSHITRLGPGGLLFRFIAFSVCAAPAWVLFS